MSLLGEVNWFARQNVSEAYRFLEEPNNVVEKIIKTRISILSTPSEEIKCEKCGKRKNVDDEEEKKSGGRVTALDDDREPYPLDSDVKIPGDSQMIIIKYQIDRYSKLPRVSRQYAASTPIFKIEEFDNDESSEKRRKEISAMDGSRIFGFEKDGKYILQYQVGEKFTVGDILTHIYKFYAGEIPTDELKKISLTNDHWGYSEKAKIALKNGTVLYQEEVMGDCMHFEGLRYMRTNSKGIPIYSVRFGS